MKERPPFNYPEFIRDVARIAVPVALQHLLTTTGSMIDTVMLGRLGENTVGAVGLCAQFSSLMFSTYWGFIGGGMLFMSQYWGAKDENGLRKAYGITLTLCALVGLLFSFLAVAAPGAVLSLYFHAPFKVVFLCVYSDEIIRYVIMQRRLYSGKWIQPVSEAGLATIGEFRKANHISSR